MKLTSSQKEAILSTDRNIAVVAVPGSGKTTVLTRRIIRLIDKGVSPRSIYALTFTNKAAEELKGRLKKEKTRSGIKVQTSTFHGFALRIIKDFGSNLGLPMDPTIYDEKDRNDIIQSILKETGRKITKKAIAKGIKEWLDEGQPNDKQTKAVIDEYLLRLKQYGGLDFDTLMIEAMNVLVECPESIQYYHDWYEYFLIDEAQDTDQRQSDMVNMLNPQNLFLVGDLDQCIYEWRSARPQIMLDILEGGHFKVIRLEESHRCPVPVAKVANHIISKNENRYEKDIKTDKEGPPVSWLSFNSKWGEADFVWDYIGGLVEKGVEAKDIFVIARTNRQLSCLSEVYRGLEDKSFKIDDLSRHTDMWNSGSVRAVINSLKLLSHADNSYLAKKSVFSLVDAHKISALISGAYSKGISLTSEMRLNYPLMDSFLNERSPTDDIFEVVRWLAEYENDKLEAMGLESQIRSVWRFVDWVFEWRSSGESASIETFLKWHAVKSIQDSMNLESDTVKLLTVHAAKGLEARYVIITGVNKGTFPSSRSSIEEERRLFYVATTRAKERLVVCYETETPSQFVLEFQ